jgi:hypothetical protein
MTPRQHAIALLQFVRSTSNNLLKDFPEAKYEFQRSPADNHVFWALGHTVLTDAWVAGVLNIPDVKAPEGWDALFGQGSKPVPDASKYPPASEMRRQFDSVRATILNWLESCPDSALQGSLKEKTGGFALDPIDGLLKLAWHEGWHFGQVATLRKELGLPPAMG